MPISQNQDLQEVREPRDSTEGCKGSGLFQKDHIIVSGPQEEAWEKAHLCRGQLGKQFANHSFNQLIIW